MGGVGRNGVEGYVKETTVVEQQLVKREEKSVKNIN